MSKLRPCPDCGKEVSKEAKTCPNCGKGLGSPNVGCGASLVIIIGALAILSLIIPDSGGPAPKPRSSVQVPDRTQVTQAKRKKLIQDTIRSGLILKIQEGRVPKVWVSRAFNQMTFDDKSAMAGVLYAYYHDGTDAYDRIEFINGMNGKKIGSFPDYRGRLDLED